MHTKKLLIISVFLCGYCISSSSDYSKLSHDYAQERVMQIFGFDIDNNNIESNILHKFLGNPEIHDIATVLKDLAVKNKDCEVSNINHSDMFNVDYILYNINYNYEPNVNYRYVICFHFIKNNLSSVNCWTSVGAKQ